jgi:glycosyltransferase involved in cell wall biosynthesis
MKIVFDRHVPAMLAHGGAQIQVDQTRLALQGIGLQADFMRWWDAGQSADVIHFVGRMPVDQMRFAQQKGIKVVMAELLTASGSHTPFQRNLRRAFRRGVETFAPKALAATFAWESYRLADALVALTAWEKQLMQLKFGAAPEKIFVIPNGVEPEFFAAPKTERGEWLVCTATITERKRVLELAQAAVAAQTPVWIIGKAYSERDAYAQKLFTLAKQNPELVRYEGGISDRTALAKAYRAARGFVLLSAMESLSLSALEAAACECPLLLSDLPWARDSFTAGTQFCPVTDSVTDTAATLKKFYAEAPAVPAPLKPATWPDVARQLKSVYEKVLAA